MAELRELLAVFDVLVNTKPLDVADQKLNVFEAHVTESINAIASRQITLPEILIPDVSAPGVDLPDMGAPSVGQVAPVQIPVELAATGLQAELRSLETQIGKAGADVLISGNSAPAQAALSELLAKSETVKAQLGTLGDGIAKDATGEIERLRASLASLGSVESRTPDVLEKLQLEATAARRQLEQLRKVDASNPSLPVLERQLSEVNAELTKAPPKARAFGAALGGLRGAVAGLGLAVGVQQLAGFARGLLDAAGDIDDATQRLNISSEDFQAWEAIAIKAGSSAQAFETSLKALSKQIVNAKEGGEEAVSAFAALGVSQEQLANTKATDLLAIVGGRIGEMGTQAERTDLALKLLGKSGTELLPAFSKGEEAVRSELEAFRELAVFSDDFIKNADDFDNAWQVVSLSLKGVAADVLNLALPAFTKLFEAFSTGEVNSELLDTAISVALAGSLLALPIAFAAISTGALTATASILAATASMGGLSGAAALLGRTLTTTFLPFAALVLIIDWLRGGESALGDFLDAVFGLGTSQGVLDSLATAFSAITTSVRVLWNTITGQDPIDGVSQRGLDSLKRLELGVKDLGAFFGGIFEGILVDATRVFSELARGIGQIYSLVPFVGDTIAAEFTSGANTLDNAVAGKRGLFEGIADGFTGGSNNVADYFPGDLPGGTIATVPATAQRVGVTTVNSPVTTNVNVTATGRVDGPAIARNVERAVHRNQQTSNKAILKGIGAHGT